MPTNKVFCGGNSCKAWERNKLHCLDCNKRICGVCAIRNEKKVYCPDCLIKNKRLMAMIKEDLKDVLTPKETPEINKKPIETPTPI